MNNYCYVICERNTLIKFCDLVDRAKEITSNDEQMVRIHNNYDVLRNKFIQILESQSECDITIITIVPIGLLFTRNFLIWMLASEEELDPNHEYGEVLRNMLISVNTTIDLTGIIPPEGTIPYLSNN